MDILTGKRYSFQAGSHGRDYLQIFGDSNGPKELWWTTASENDPRRARHRSNVATICALASELLQSGVTGERVTEIIFACCASSAAEAYLVAKTLRQHMDVDNEQ